MNKGVKNFLIFAAGVIVVVGVVWFGFRIGGQDKDNLWLEAKGQVVAELPTGEKITNRDIEARYDLDKCYGGEWTKEITAVEVIQAAYENAVLKSEFGYFISVEELRDDFETIKQNQSAEIWSCVEEAFQGDEDMMLKLFIAPLSMRQHLGGRFSASDEWQAERISLIDGIWNEIGEGRSLEDYKESNMVIIRKDTGFFPFRAEDEETIIMPMDDPIAEMVISLDEGEMWPNVIETQESFIIIKLVSESEEEYLARAITVDKVDYNDWFRGRALSLGRLNFYDRELLDEVRSYMSNAWWLAAVR